MPYSDWTHSTWYTYWQKSAATKKEDEIFRIFGARRDVSRAFTYRELKGDLDNCIRQTRLAMRYNKDELLYEELGLYMKRFLRRCDRKVYVEMIDGKPKLWSRRMARGRKGPKEPGGQNFLKWATNKENDAS